MFDLAIIVPHLNDAQRLRRCLDGLRAQVDDAVEVFVVDNGSDFSMSEIESDYPWATFAIQTEAGAGPARNIGVLLSAAPRLAFIDCDCVPAINWIARARAVDVSGSIVGGRVDTFHEGQGRPSGAQVFEQVFAFDMARYVAQKGFCGSGNMVTSRAVFEAVGPFRADVSEDVEWCQRAGRAGFAIVYDDALLAYHPTRADWVSLKRKWRRLAAERFLTEATSTKGRFRWVVRAVLTAGSVVRDVPRVLGTRRLEKARDRLSCLIVLIRLRFLRAYWMSCQAWTGRA